MRSLLLTVTLVTSCLGSEARGQDYVLDFRKLKIVVGADAQTTEYLESTEVGVLVGEDFSSHARIGAKTVGVSGVLENSEMDADDYVLSFSLRFVDEDAAPKDAVTRLPNETSFATTLKAKVGTPIMLGGVFSSSSARPNQLEFEAVIIALDVFPKSEEEDADRRKRIKEKHDEIVKLAIEAHRERMQESKNKTGSSHSGYDDSVAVAGRSFLRN